MSFPKLKTHQHSLTLPVGKRKIQYRGWTAREENFLLIAKKAGTEKAQAEAVASIVSAVTDGKVDPATDAVVDVLFTFLMSRARGVGELAQISFACGCGEDGEVPATVNLSAVTVTCPDQNKIFKVGDSDDGEIHVELKNLSFDDYASAAEAEHPDSHVFRKCVARMYSDEGSIDIESITDAEWREFYFDIPTDNLREIEKFFENRPSAKSTAVGVCKSCGKERTKEIVGLSDFM